MQAAKKIFISCFIMINFLSFVRVHMPIEKPFFKAFYTPVDQYLSFFSIYQDWLMFAPNPAKLNAFLSAEIEFEDGTIDSYLFPNSEKLSWLNKYANGEKYRKYISEGVRKDSNQFMWKDTAKFVLHKMKEKHGYKLPLRVRLIRHWNEIENIHKTFVSVDDHPTKYESYNFYTYEVGE